MNIDNLIYRDCASADYYNTVDEYYDDTFKQTLTVQERFRYEVLVFMKKNGFKLINSKFFKKKDICIPVNYIEASYRETKKLDLYEIVKYKKIIKSL